MLKTTNVDHKRLSRARAKPGLQQLDLRFAKQHALETMMRLGAKVLANPKVTQGFRNIRNMASFVWIAPDTAINRDKITSLTRTDENTVLLVENCFAATSKDGQYQRNYCLTFRDGEQADEFAERFVQHLRPTSLAQNVETVVTNDQGQLRDE